MHSMADNIVKTTEKSGVESVAGGSMTDIDKAFQFAKEHNVEPLTEAEGKRILRRIDWHLLPLVSGFCFPDSIGAGDLMLNNMYL